MDNIRSILVHMDATQHSANRLRFAKHLAARHGAQVRALFAVAPRFVPIPVALDGGKLPPGPLLDEIDPSHRVLAREQFEKEAKDAACPMVWEELKEQPPLEGFCRHALHVDLMVLGQADPTAPDRSDVPAGFAENVIIMSRKPAIIVPHHPHPPPADPPRLSKVLIAWQARPETARAVAEALPLLRQAEEVHLATWADDRQSAAEAQQGVTGYLELHGIRGLQGHCGARPANVGEALLSMARDVDAGLLVMGCYGHGRTRELVWGGATNTVLHKMHLPTLMAH